MTCPHANCGETAYFPCHWGERCPKRNTGVSQTPEGEAVSRRTATDREPVTASPDTQGAELVEYDLPRCSAERASIVGWCLVAAGFAIMAGAYTAGVAL